MTRASLTAGGIIMALTLPELQKMNNDARTVLEQSVTRLRQLRVGARPTDQAIITDELTQAQTDLDRRDMIATHLEAAGTIVKPMPQQLEAELRTLGAKLDDAIRRDALLTARLETLVDALNESRKLAAEIREHT
jgi:hypothetical protein